MKPLLVLFTLSLLSCSKVKPDWDQITCQQCISIKEKWQEPAMINLISKDTLVNVTLCADQLANFQRLANDTLLKICNAAGETIFYEHRIDIVKN